MKRAASMFSADNPHQSSRPWRVSALIRALQDLMAQRFPTVRVLGEISSLSRPSSGHLYFSLKDDQGSGELLRCAMFKRAAQILDFVPRDGQHVEIWAKPTIYEPRGDLQLVVEAMRLQGAGSLYEQFLALRARLEAQGLFDPARRRAIPAWPRAVGVVTSLGAAALHDVLTALQRRAPHVRVVIYPCLVQGAQAPDSILSALNVAQTRAEVDTLLLVRGGGSLEDLWSFNDERVVRALRACSLPVVCGVGHETDITLADLAADLRAPTPTAAAELVAPTTLEARQDLDELGARAQRAVQRLLDRQAQGLDHLALRAGQPAKLLAAPQERLAQWSRRLDRALSQRLSRERETLSRLTDRHGQAPLGRLERQADALQHWQARLIACHPQQVLRRGFAWVQDASGQAIVSVGQVRVGQSLTTVWADGQAHTLVQGVETTESPGA